MTPHIGSLFSGFAGLDQGVAEVFGGETVWFSEIDPAPSKILAYHYPNVPNLGDITKIDWATVPPVDILTGGFPCQDVSLAGARAGLKEGTRSGLWSYFAAAIDALRPGLVVIENVRGLLSATTLEEVDETDSHLEWSEGSVGIPVGVDRPVLNAFGRVLGDLAVLGYDAEWVGIRAADAGAPHGRFRVFILAHPNNGRRRQRGAELGGLSIVDPLGKQSPANPSRNESQRWGISGDMGGPQGSDERTSEERERVRDTTSDSRSTFADSDNSGRSEHGGGASQLNRNSLPLNTLVTLLGESTNPQ